MTRDARPFLAHHLRERADARDHHGSALHDLARWVENLPGDDPAMLRIASTEALDYSDGGFVCKAASNALIDAYQRDAPASRRQWLAWFADAVEHDHAHHG